MPFTFVLSEKDTCIIADALEHAANTSIDSTFDATDFQIIFQMITERLEY